ncbi:hypothetical protein X771_11555 [Mesorhizobium sp. LSJC277A00]|nr:hypothetical protein X771_11555 [Mesorhizobium sp. LSJC277A00]
MQRVSFASSFRSRLLGRFRAAVDDEGMLEAEEVASVSGSC